MRRNIELYIGGQLVELSEQSFILMNYTHDDLTNPTILKNSYSQQIEIEGTPTNDKIFGSIYRFDRRTIAGGGIGVQFDAAKKTPFLLFNGGELVESGYMKLDNISIKGEKKSYKISLYGGLGSFLYSLSYDENGEKMSLSDLDFGTDLTFIINKESVIDAWDNIGSGKWGIINFAPCYNGYPDKLDADKMVVSAYAFPFDTSASEEAGEGEDPVLYYPRGGNVLFKYNEPITEWEAQELRSWLQRPVVRWKEILAAIARSSGYNITLDSAFFQNSNPYYEDTWMTLPLIFEQVALSAVERTIPFGLTFEVYDGGTFVIDLPLIPSGTDMVMNAELDLSIHWQSQVISNFYLDHYNGETDEFNVFLAQILAYDANGTIIGGSDAKVVSTRNIDLVDIVQQGVLPPYSGANVDLVVGTFTEVDNTDEHFRFNTPITFTMQSNNIASLRLYFGGYSFLNGVIQETFSPKYWSSQSGDISPIVTNLDVILSGGIEFESMGNATSGSTITQSMILKTEKTPADYLISYCKMFGLSIMVNEDTKEVNILTRGTMFNNPSLIDIEDKVDISKDISIIPYPYVSKWYAMSQEMKGEFVENYKNTIGKVFGVQRIDTGYDFSSEEKQLLSGLSFVGAAEVLERSKLFANYSVENYGSRRIVPAAVLLGGTYSLYNNNGGSMDLDIVVPEGISGVYFNADYPGYDGLSKVQLHEAENKATSGNDVLLFYRGAWNISSKYANLRVTDDSSIMSALNEGKPCWTYGNSDSETRITHIPYFSRYQFSMSVPGQVSQSLDFGVPAELGIPDITIAENAGIYAQYWKDYIQDRFDDDSKVVNCYLLLRGLPKGFDLLRRFVYFKGAIWSINKIINESLTSEEVTQVELIKVQDIDKYI